MVNGRHAGHNVISTTTQENKVPTTRWTKVVAVAGVSAVLLVSCGSDSKTDSSAATDGTEAEAPEGVTVPDATVTAGLTKSSADITALAARVGNGATEADVDELFEDWEKYEGTVKANEVDTYLALEDALAAMKSAVKANDATAAKKAADDFTTSAHDYLTKHP
jgi:ABC-type glycerol-3-phosphate transport system substrate-binding protein